MVNKPSKLSASKYQWLFLVPLKGGTWRTIPGLGYVVNNHGDRKSPKWGYSDSPYKLPFYGL